MAVRAAFQPNYTVGQVLTPAAAAVSVSIDPQAKAICLTNLGSNLCYVRVGTGTFSATTTDYPVPPGTQQIISKADGDNVLSHISASGTTLHIVTGEGY